MFCCPGFFCFYSKKEDKKDKVENSISYISTTTNTQETTDYETPSYTVYDSDEPSPDCDEKDSELGKIKRCVNKISQTCEIDLTHIAKLIGTNMLKQAKSDINELIKENEAKVEENRMLTKKLKFLLIKIQMLVEDIKKSKAKHNINRLFYN